MPSCRHPSEQNHRKFQQEVRKFVDEVIYPDAQAREEDGKRASQDVFDKMAYVSCTSCLPSRRHLTAPHVAP